MARSKLPARIAALNEACKQADPEFKERIGKRTAEIYAYYAAMPDDRWVEYFADTVAFMRRMYIRTLEIRAAFDAETRRMDHAAREA